MNDPFRPWGKAECAEFLGVSTSHFDHAVRYVDGFPKPLTPYVYNLAGKERTSRPEWAGIDVMTWRLGEERIALFFRYGAEKPNKNNDN